MQRHLEDAAGKIPFKFSNQTKIDAKKTHSNSPTKKVDTIKKDPSNSQTIKFDARTIMTGKTP